MLDHHNFLKPTEKEPVLVDECLNDILQMWSHQLKFSKVAKLILKQRWPPADGKVFTVHTINFASFCHSENKEIMLSAKRLIKLFAYYFTFHSSFLYRNRIKYAQN